MRDPQPSESKTGQNRKVGALKPLWARVLRLLVDCDERLAPGLIAHRLDLPLGGRRDQTVRAALQALERRGLVKRSGWLSVAEYWEPTEEGRALVAEAENTRQLARDAELHGTTFTDVTGKRIDPETIRPSTDRESCARDSDWCDGRRCRELGIDCPNADPEEDRA